MLRYKDEGLIKGINMARISKLLTDEVVCIAESGLAKLGKSGHCAIKLRAVIAAHKHGITEVARIFNITKASLISWIKHVKNGSLELLRVQEGRGPKRRLTEEHKQLIAEWVKSDPQVTIDKIRLRLKEEAGLEIGRSTVHRAMKALNFSYITPRPKHYKQKTNPEEAKKKSSTAD